MHIGWGLCDHLCLVLVCRGRYGLGGWQRRARSTPTLQDYYAGSVVKLKKTKRSATGKGWHTVFADE